MDDQRTDSKSGGSVKSIVAVVLLIVAAGITTAPKARAAGPETLASINANLSYTAFDFTGQTQQASHASFGLSFPGAGISLNTGLIPFAGSFPSKSLFDAHNDGFDELANLLADQSDDILRTDLMLWLANGSSQRPAVGGGTAPESRMVFPRSNLIGARVTSIELEVGFMSHTVSGSSERLSVNARWNIIGRPVPEPSSAIAMFQLLGFGVLTRFRRQR